MGEFTLQSVSISIFISSSPIHLVINSGLVRFAHIVAASEFIEIVVENLLVMTALRNFFTNYLAAPPSIVRQIPLTNDASSEARYR
jgi:hypothetical protein